MHRPAEGFELVIAGNDTTLNAPPPIRQQLTPDKAETRDETRDEWHNLGIAAITSHMSRRAAVLLLIP